MLQILIQPALGELGAVIVAPDSLDGRWSTPANERAVNALLAAVEKNYVIDQKKVIVTGFSMGGQGTWYWGEKYPDRFSAACHCRERRPPLRQRGASRYSRFTRATIRFSRSVRPSSGLPN
jgi:pimeloyl-ACP methyl ester carboxylesterase